MGARWPGGGLVHTPDLLAGRAALRKQLLGGAFLIFGPMAACNTVMEAMKQELGVPKPTTFFVALAVFLLVLSFAPAEAFSDRLRGRKER